MKNPRCGGRCGGDRQPGKYLCYSCWGRLPAETRRRLKMTDGRKVQRAKELFAQLHDERALAEIEVAP